ncbi:hypothetical protein [Stutzerimonas frequens]|uniref:hypothetical protein n=1 Tax=Stutzerimonas frequens TaxID=2968969 RepID=UPI003748A1EA
MNAKKRKGVLSDHYRKGKRLIPPLMRIGNIQETSFKELMIPELVWMSAIFNRASDRSAVEGVIDFQIACREALDSADAPHLSFLSNFNRLSDTQREKILLSEKCQKILPFLRHELWHQNAVFDSYPLSFIFSDRPEYDRSLALERLKLDVDSLLDRYTPHSAKVQTTAVVAMIATEKMFLDEQIDLPDPNTIFTSPGSDDAKRVASFARATLNAGSSFVEGQAEAEKWVSAFWTTCFFLEGCR